MSPHLNKSPASVAPVGADRPAKGAASPSRKFNEKTLQADVRQLLEDGDYDAAVKYLVDALPGLHASRLNAREKLNNLQFLARTIQLNGGSKYGYTKLRSKFMNLNKRLRGYELSSDGGFVEFGCGAHDPVALSSYFFVNGAGPNYAVDMLPPRNPVYSAMSMYDILTNMTMFPQIYCRGETQPADLLARLKTFDVAAFERGDYEGGMEGLKGSVQLCVSDLLESPIQAGTIKLFTSFAVLEHVTEIDAICSRIYDLLIPGGIAFHFIDLADHRNYRGDGAFGPLDFLTEAQGPANLNRLRAPEIAAAHVRAGFQVIADDRSLADMPGALRDSLVEPFRSMPVKGRRRDQATAARTQAAGELTPATRRASSASRR